MTDLQVQPPNRGLQRPAGSLPPSLDLSHSLHGQQEFSGHSLHDHRGSSGRGSNDAQRERAGSRSPLSTSSQRTLSPGRSMGGVPSTATTDATSRSPIKSTLSVTIPDFNRLSQAESGFTAGGASPRSPGLLAPPPVSLPPSQAIKGASSPRSSGSNSSLYASTYQSHPQTQTHSLYDPRISPTKRQPHSFHHHHHQHPVSMYGEYKTSTSSPISPSQMSFSSAGTVGASASGSGTGSAGSGARARPRQSSRNTGQSSRNRMSSVGPGTSSYTYYGTIGQNGVWNVASQQIRSGSGNLAVPESASEHLNAVHPHDQRSGPDSRNRTDTASQLQLQQLSGTEGMRREPETQLGGPSLAAPIITSPVPLRGSHFLGGSPGSAATSSLAGINLPPIRRSGAGPSSQSPRTHQPTSPPVRHDQSSTSSSNPLASHASKSSLGTSTSSATSTPTKKSTSNPAQPDLKTSWMVAPTRETKFTSPPPPPPLTDLPLPPLPPLPTNFNTPSVSSAAKKATDGTSAGQLGYRAPTSAPRFQPIPRSQDTSAPTSSASPTNTHSPPTTAPSASAPTLPPKPTAEEEDTMLGLGLGPMPSGPSGSGSVARAGSPASHFAQNAQRSVSAPVPQLRNAPPGKRGSSPLGAGASPQPQMRSPALSGKSPTMARPSSLRESHTPSPRMASQPIPTRRSEDNASRPSFTVNRLPLPPPPEKRPANQKKSSQVLRNLFGLGNSKSKDKNGKSPDLAAAPTSVPNQIKGRKSFDILPSLPRRRASEEMLRSRAAQVSPMLQGNDRQFPATPEPLGQMMKLGIPQTIDSRQPAPVPAVAGKEAYDGISSSDDDITSDAESSHSDTTEKPRSISPLPPSLSLHFSDLPALDSSVTSAFDSIFQGLKTSPKKTRRRSRSFSSCNDPELRHSSSRSIASKTSKILEEDTEPPSLTMSDHGRTFSSTTASLSDSSPPRTPGSSENVSQAVAIHSGSSASVNEIPQSRLPELPIEFTLSSEKLSPPTPQLVAKVPADLDQPETSKTSATTLAPAAEIQPAQEKVAIARKTRPLSIVIPSRPILASATALETASALRTLLSAFRRGEDKAILLRSHLLDCMMESEKAGLKKADRAGTAIVRQICVEWVHELLIELQVDQPANERGACLEALSAVIESHVFSEAALEGLIQDQATFRDLVARIMSYVLSKLSGKGVFHNTLLFSGRMLAFAFFRIEGIAVQLLSALPIKAIVLSRFIRACKEFTEETSERCTSRFPEHLQTLCLDTPSAYIHRMSAAKPEYETSAEEEAFHFKPGNWLRRWQSDDSELFPAFYKAFHRQMATYLGEAVAFYEEHGGRPVPVSHLLSCPGYAHLAAVFATKCHSYIVGAVNAVTTTSASTQFDANETAGFKGNVKPPILETANRRLSDVILNLTMARMFPRRGSGEVLEVYGHSIWASMIEAWVKTLISRTSLYSPKGVFCLFDLLDSIMAPDHEPLSLDSGRVLNSSIVVDIPYLISVIRIVLTETEHHLTLARCVAFVWTHFEVFTARNEDREALCVQLLLDPIIFQRLMLFWSQSVRSYVLRLIVFRLGHIDNPNDISIVTLLNRRLEQIRKRHNELEPAAFAETLNLPSKSKITPVTTEDPADRPFASPLGNEVEGTLGLSPARGDQEIGSSPDMPQSAKGMSKASKWLKSFSKQKKAGKNAMKSGSEGNVESDSASTTSRMSVESSRPSPDQMQRPAKAASTRSDVDAPFGVVKSDTATSSQQESDMVPRTPKLLDDEVPPLSQSPCSPTGVAFEFEIPMTSPRSDTFDRRPTPPSPKKPQRLPASPHMSRSFSKRSSLLHPVAAAMVLEVGSNPSSSQRRESPSSSPKMQPYDKRLHPYCIRMLAELEDVQREYDEWWAEDGPGRLDNAPPRLNVAWPFSEEDD